MKAPSRSFAVPVMSRTAWGWAAAACLVIGCFFFAVWHGPMPFEGVIRWLAARDGWKDGVAVAADERLLRLYYSRAVGLALLVVGVVTAAGLIWVRLSEAWRRRF